MASLGICFGLHSSVITECKTIADIHFQSYLCLEPHLFLSIFQQNAQSPNVIYSVGLAAEHTASISSEGGAQKSILTKAGKHRPLICLFTTVFLLEKGLR